MEPVLTGLAIVIPALNESATIGAVIKASLTVAERVILVDDGSTDGTGQIAAEAGAQVVRNERPQGYDAAIARGLNSAFEAGALAAVTCDADGQHRLEDVRKIAAPVVAGELDYCGGVRDHYNRPVEAAVGLISKRLLGSEDPFCGLKCYSRLVYEKCGPFPRELNIGTIPMVWVKKSGMRFAYLPIRVLKRRDQPRFGPFLRSNIRLARAFLGTMVVYGRG